jgi:hypothetical protein
VNTQAFKEFLYKTEIKMRLGEILRGIAGEFTGIIPIDNSEIKLFCDNPECRKSLGGGLISSRDLRYDPNNGKIYHYDFDCLVQAEQAKKRVDNNYEPDICSAKIISREEAGKLYRQGRLAQARNS